MHQGQTEWDSDRKPDKKIDRTHLYWAERASWWEPSGFRAVSLPADFPQGDRGDEWNKHVEEYGQAYFGQIISNPIGCEQAEEPIPSDEEYMPEDEDETETTHKPQPLHSFEWNSHSPTNRFVEAAQKHEAKHTRAREIQSEMIYCISWVDLMECQHNHAMSSPFNRDTVFAAFDGLEYIFVPTECLGAGFEPQTKWTAVYAIVGAQSMIMGLLTLMVKPSNRRSVQKAYIHQRAKTSTQISLSNSTMHQELSQDIITHMSCTEFVPMVSTTHDYNPTLVHHVQYVCMDIRAFMQGDNKGKNCLCGHGSNTSKYPCPVCYVNKEQLLDIPRTNSFGCQTRTMEESIQNATLAKQLPNKAWDLKASKGSKYAPIYDIQPHQWGASTLHNAEGIYAIVMDTFKDALRAETECTTQMTKLQKQQQALMDSYELIMRDQDLLKHKETLMNEETQAWFEHTEHKHPKNVEKYEKQEERFEKELTKHTKSNQWLKFVQILHKYKINLHYCMAGSVQGIMCTRIDQARHELTELTDDYNHIVRHMWQSLFMNLTYLHDMLKKKHNWRYNVHDIATMKRAYLDLCHQMVLIVKKYRQQGGIGVKLHYLRHDIEMAEFLGYSPAFLDDQRIENVNQHLKEYTDIYSKYYGLNKEELMARRMNIRTLSCG